MTVLSVELGDLAAVADLDAVVFDLTDEVVGHRLAQVAPAMQERHERAALGEPDRSLAGGVAAADHADARRAAELRLGRAGRVEHARALVVGEILERQPAVLGAGRQDDGARDDLVPLLEPDNVAAVAGLERNARGTGVAGRAPNFRACVTARPSARCR